jgi:hypothetical protein
MKPEDRVLLASARQNLQIEHRREIADLIKESPLDWLYIVHTSEKHGLAPMIGDNISSCASPDVALPTWAKERFELRKRQNLSHKNRAKRKIVTTLAWFNARKIDVMLLKGAALDFLIYSEPWKTGPSDVDLVLRCERGSRRFETTRKFVRSLYESGVECDYFEHHDVTMNGALKINFAEIWERVSPIEIDGHRALVMDPEDTLLTLCINSCRKRFFRLKSLCDIAESVQGLPLCWEQLARRAVEYKCTSIVYAALLIARSTIGCAIPAGALDQLRTRKIRASAIDSLMRYLLQSRSIGSLWSFSGHAWSDKKLDLSLFLPYLSYQGPQFWRSLYHSLGS